MMEITPQVFEQQRHPRFGTTNPERIQSAFWEWMVHTRYWPSRARRVLDFKDVPHTGPEWSFGRMGETRTELSDGRVVCIAGEHEDWYDPDFYIYNDVVVLGPKDRVEIYGYPKEVFPPTDFHTATLVGDRIIVIGSLGYSAHRQPGFTPVYSLDTTTFAIEPVATNGPMPGWIFEHEAELDTDGRGIVVKGGQTMIEQEGSQIFRTNLEEFRLDLADLRWQQLTDRSQWRQFLIERVDGHYWFQAYDDQQQQFALPQSVPYETLPELDFQTRQISIEGVVVQISQDLTELRVIFRGALPPAVVTAFVAELLNTIEAATKAPCSVRSL